MVQSIPRPEYPRPNLKRDLWMNLNGEWDFEFDDENVGEIEKWYKDKAFSRKIVVPFCFQSKLSGIHTNDFHDYVWYKRSFSIPEEFRNKRVLLNFGAVDYYAKVWVNGEMVGDHIGGSTPFSFDITSFLCEGSNTIVVRAEDSSTECRQPRGKQSWMKENFGCWYERTTGIWQTVWLEAVSQSYIEKVRLTPDLDNDELAVEAEIKGSVEGLRLNTRISFKGLEVDLTEKTISRSRVSFVSNVRSDSMEWKVARWTPEHPNLYDIEFSLIDDEGNCIDRVESYFGMRKVSCKGNKFLLNNVPYYQKLILDQGYFPDSLLTPPSEEAIKEDIRYTKEFGYNGARKHQKVEDPIYLYWCDKMGLLVWGEMASPYEYDETMVKANMTEWMEVVERDYNHPCIIAWTLMNESWGIPDILTDYRQQQHTLALYHMVKSLDSTRLVISNDGWEHTMSDITTIHDYVEDGEVFAERYKDINEVMNGAPNKHKHIFANGYGYEGQPVLLSEYGGIAFEKDEGWGYGNKVKDEESFLERFEKITRAIARPGYFVGYCYTQLTDVQQEENGLLTFDRKPKIAPEKIKRINDMVGFK
ncbi:MAG: glycoside hydrolase family 2 protein [Caldicoprobacterales bacterium]|nr:glycoside hydrolase family 2 [Clostridiales bacterium]